MKKMFYALLITCFFGLLAYSGNGGNGGNGGEDGIGIGNYLSLIHI